VKAIPGRILREPSLRRRALLTAIVLPLSFVPMAGTLGYFSSLLLAPILGLLAAAAGVDAVRAIRAAEPRPSSGPEALWRVLRIGIVELAWLIGLPIGLLLVGMLWNTNCDPLGGSLYYFMGPACTAVIGFTAGVVGAVIGGERSRGKLLALGQLPFFACLFLALWRLYYEPVVFAFDPFWGWYSGPIYDEHIAIGTRYVLFRTYNFAVVASAWLLLRVVVDERLIARWGRLRSPGPDRVRTVVGLAIGLAALVTGWHGDRLGWTATEESLTRVLSATRETEHFVIHYVPGSATAREIDVVAAEHEFAWHTLAQKLGRTPQRKVVSYVFTSGEQRQFLLGADKVEVSPPWRQHMYLSQRPWPHDVMPHELGHSFLGEFGDPILGLPIRGLHFDGALVEGLPTALAPRPLDNLDLHEQAAVLDRLGKRPPMQQIMGAGFWTASASRAYTAAGSFVLWLAETRGWPEVGLLYDNAGDVEETYGESLADLEAEWLAFLHSLPLREQDVAAQAQRFERASVFRRPCAHRAADLATEAAQARLRDQREEALEAVQTLCSIEPERPEHALLLADMLASYGMLEDANATLDETAARDDLTSTVTAAIEEQRGDTALVAGDFDRAARHYRDALGYGQREAGIRVLEIKQMAAADPKLAPLIIDYFGIFQLDDKGQATAMLRLWAASEISRLPGHWALGHYLLGRNFLNVSVPEQALEVLDRANNPPAGEPRLESPVMRRALRWALVSALVQTRKWDRAREVLDVIEREDVEGRGHTREIADWRARVDFYEEWFAANDRG
jgi:tetratricopeptide (TPR) repeat protein